MNGSRHRDAAIFSIIVVITIYFVDCEMPIKIAADNKLYNIDISQPPKQ